jgi:hypothetical protein
MRKFIKHVLTPPLMILAFIVFLIERLIIDDIKALSHWLAKLKLIQAIEAKVSTLSPYAALACFLLPGMVLLPFKFLALNLFSTGNLVGGIVVLFGAKIVGTLFVTRIFMAAKPALLSLRWFAFLYHGIVGMRDRLYGLVKEQPWWQAVAALVHRIHDAVGEFRGKVAFVATRMRRRWQGFIRLRFRAIRRRFGIA